MNVLDHLIKKYNDIHLSNIKPKFLLVFIRRLVKLFSQIFLPVYLRYSKTYKPGKPCDVIVSFTSFPARINNVWQVVECMFRQTYQPKKIILWLSKEQFKDISSIPKRLLRMQNDIFSIEMVDGDIRSHKKYFYVFNQYKNENIVLIDDDIYYPTNMIENLINTSRKYPNSVVCRYAHIMQYDNLGNLLPYNSFIIDDNVQDSSHFFLGTGGGTLINPNLLYKDVCNISLFSQLTPLADDVWINAMIKINDISIKKIKCELLLPIYNRRTTNLSNINNGKNKNDQQINAVIRYYKRIIGINPFENRTYEVIR